MNTTALNHRSKCPLSTALDFIGDKWSLLIVRDMCMEKARYGDFLSSPEGIPTNILADRLRRLEETGLLEKKPYQLKPLRFEYVLTAKGADLLPVIQELAIWANQHFPECVVPPERFLTANPADLLTQKNKPK
jgi:DNA-binding HxlR family transcriptional regulator